MTFSKENVKRIAAIFMIFAVIISFAIGTGLGKKVEAASGLTGQGLKSHAYTAYNQHWSYVYGGASPGAVDCSGLIYSYGGAGGCHSSGGMYGSASEKGSASSIPEIPGLGLYTPGHVGIYVGGGMAIDAENESVGVCLKPVAGRWTSWFKVPGVSYDGGSSSDSSSSAGSSVASSSKSKPQAQAQNTQQVNSALKLGSSGLEVQVLQTRLAQLGYYKYSDTGYFGEETKQSLMAFQTKAGIDATGVLDDKTKTVLFSNNAPICIVNYSKGMYDDGGESNIRDIQTRLNQLEYLAGDCISGYFGDDTANAVATFQDAAGREVNGIVDPDTKEALMSDSAPMNPKTGIVTIGATGEEVFQIQQRLFDLRYSNQQPNGVFSEETAESVKKFQQANAMQITGSLNRGEKAVLLSQAAAVSPESNNLKLGYQGEDVQVMKNKLEQLGYINDNKSDDQSASNSALTNKFDEVTEQAVMDFQDDHAIEQTGIATISTRIAMDASIKSGDTAESSQSSGVKAAALANNNSNLSDTSMDIFWIVFVAFVMVGSVTLAYYIRRNPYFIRSIERRVKTVLVDININK